MRCRFVLGSSFLMLNAVVEAQNPGAAAVPPPPPSAITGVSEVVVDFVARDNHSNPVTDLHAEEIRISDGGTPVKIARLRLMNGKPGSAEPRFVSFVFDALDPYAAPAARKAADGMLSSLASTGASFSVWRTGERLELLQTFTQDPALLYGAIEAAASSAGKPGALSRAGTGELALNAQRTLERWDRIERDERLRPPVSGLVALARQQGALQGRKAIVYFSDGVQLGSALPEQLRAIAGSANRAGVVIFTVNTAGLSSSLEKKESLILDSSDGHPAPAAAAKSGADSLPFTFIQLDSELGPPVPLKDLAESTGGFYIRRLGDLEPSARKIADDLTTYYEAAYAAPNEDANGQFRRRSVRVSRPHVRVQSGNGYFDVPADAGVDTAPFEVPMLKALGSPQRTLTIPFQADVLHLGQVDGKARGEVVLEMPLSGVDCRADASSVLCETHFSVLALVKDAKGQVVRTFSQDVSDQMESEALGAGRDNAYTFQRSFALPPGDYRLDAAVFDRQANKLSSRSTSFSLSLAPELSLCDLFLVTGLEPLEPKSDPDDQLRYQDGRVVPLLIPVWKWADRDVQAFFLVAPDAKIATPPHVALEVERDKRVVARPAVKLLDHRPGSPIPASVMLKRESLEKGHYQLLVKVTQGKESLERELNFEVLTPPALGQPAADAAKAGVAAEGAGALRQAAAAAKAGGAAEAPEALLNVKLLPGSQKPDPAEVKRILAVARERAADYRSALPDFVCTRTTTMFWKKKGAAQWVPAMIDTDLLQYVGGSEKAEPLTAREVANVPGSMKKLALRGEFGGLLGAVFNESNAAQIEWQGMAEVKGIRVHVFQYQVSRQHSAYMLSPGGDQGTHMVAAYRGLVLIDANTLDTRRVVVEAVDLPPNFPIHQSAIAVDYDHVRIADKRYLVPQRATWMYLQASRQPVRWDRVFQNYRKYATSSDIKYMGEAAQ